MASITPHSGKKGGFYTDSVSEQVGTALGPFQLIELDDLNMIRYESRDNCLRVYVIEELERRKGVGRVLVGCGSLGSF